MSPYEVACPTCNAGTQQFCHTLTTPWTTVATHPARWDARLDQALTERDKAAT